ncbi:30S ribosomal protein S6 [Pyruvatibacter mobilis]|jgi:small subunit ribosomal protein S6|uniref:30S ribosomal protein S6 n=1 Tax=Pyruvatibacter mobilis TaxID=1712261 RepID=UPI003BA9E328
MALYEHVFIARQDVSAQQVETLTEEFKTVLESNGGSVAKAEYWGIKTLAYKIKKNRKGHYTLLNIDAPHAAVAEMERQMGLHDDILRFITLRVDEHEEGPSAMMQARGRDDRRGGRGGDRGGRGGDRGGRGDRGDRGGDRGDRGGDRSASTEAKKEGADA